MAKLWKERLIDLENAVNRLEEAITDSKNYKLESLKDAVIQRYEFTIELSWKAMKIYLNYEGIMEATTPKQTIREAFAKGFIFNGQLWLDMIDERNLTSHTYNQEIANKIYINICDIYIGEIKEVLRFLKNKEI